MKQIDSPNQQNPEAPASLLSESGGVLITRIVPFVVSFAIIFGLTYYVLLPNSSRNIIETLKNDDQTKSEYDERDSLLDLKLLLLDSIYNSLTKVRPVSVETSLSISTNENRYGSVIKDAIERCDYCLTLKQCSEQDKRLLHKELLGLYKIPKLSDAQNSKLREYMKLLKPDKANVQKPKAQGAVNQSNVNEKSSLDTVGNNRYEFDPYFDIQDTLN